MSNIYDLAGNVHELTLEQTMGWPDKQNITRGEVFGTAHGKCSARGWLSTEELSQFVVFRVTLY